MKKVLILSLTCFLTWCINDTLNAQNCQPSPACKAVCAKMKGDAAQVNPAPATPVQTATSQNTTTEARAFPVSWYMIGNSTSGKKAASNCNPGNCDPSQCDPSQCDPSKCDPSQCDPSKCMPVTCKGVGSKAKAVRL